MNYNVKYFNKDKIHNKFQSYVLGADIGGTNTNLCVAGIKNKIPILLFSVNFQSQKLDSFYSAVTDTLNFAMDTHNIAVHEAVIGAAGVVSPNHDAAELTNVPLNISTKELLNKTSLSDAYIINDFQTIGYGINLLDPNNTNDLFLVRSSRVQTKPSMATKAILGAGTGLGKSILVYDEQFNAYVPLPSEGGHSDLPVSNDDELALVNFIKKLRGIQEPLSYEEVLSGRGIKGIYLYLRESEDLKQTPYTEQIDHAEDKPVLIAKYRDKDETCKETFRLFTRFYGRCVKNFVLDTLAIEGVYIAGGIASKNRDIFTTPEFLDEFQQSHQRAALLQAVPISVIVNYDVSLYGACFAAMYRTQKDTR